MMSIIVNAQQGDINFGDLPRPVPSISSLPTYTESPISLATGIPDISYPLLSLLTNDKGISANLSLQYHPANMDETQAGSEVGMGWTMFSGGVISREIVDELDERYDDASWQYYQKNKFNDVYYYNLPGISGKFKIERNTDNNTFKVLNLTPNNIKIEYTRNSNNATLIINSFTITDGNGFKYLFNDYGQSRSYRNAITSGTLYKSAFYLTQVKNAANVALLSFEYQKENKMVPGSTNILYQICKVKNITSPGLGSIVIDYNYDQTLENTMNDPYSITKVSLKNSIGNIIGQYGFEYMMMGYSIFGSIETANKRTLTRIHKINLENLTGPPLETTKLLYSQLPYFSPENSYGPGDPCNATEGVNLARYAVKTLNKIVMPTGGMVEYNYDANEYYTNKSLPGYATPGSFGDPSVQYMSTFKGIAVNTKQTNTYTFQVTGDPGVLKKIYITFEATKYKPVFADDSFVDYSINGGSVSAYTCYNYNDPELEGNARSLKNFDLYPGTYTITMSGTGGYGEMTLQEIKNIPAPFRNASNNNPQLGIRIKNVKYYNSEFNPTLQKSTDYNYNVFSDPNSVSGSIFYPERESSSTVGTPFVLYKNVKVTNSGNNGYVNYYFKTPNDYPKFPYTHNGSNVSFWPYYNITRAGVQEKNEAYNAQNKPVSASLYDFSFETLNDFPDIAVDGGFTKKAYLKSSKITTKNYQDNNRYVENKVETEFNTTNFRVASVKETSSDGSISEKYISYPIGLAGYQNLENANMIGVPVITEIKNNGKVISRTEVKYNGAIGVYPSSVIAVNPNDNSTKTVVRYDEYDSRGNIKQMTSNPDVAGGNPSVIIWGYNQSFPIAKIEGAKLSDIGTLADDIVLKSNADVDASSEVTLMNALDSFRNNPGVKNFIITTYTYDPMIGITTVTPATGLREIYKYDKNGRLISVVDVNGNIIKDYKYNTKPQL
ncbi:hypothetical protein J2787_003893 [Chryseobacterium rhizosphaerae]|uniref:YD repeat-containing protein n=1 Tax=Chryseobacterium rhizosphaerae TaxID=395937 RepID=A0AAE3YE26_9FLAO|nr:hypothetical protein [Chryseobacterium rhizosphaerae]MDR6528456.1 hypothetical protein [Chryseobacterium rhizosphaerae]